MRHRTDRILSILSLIVGFLASAWPAWGQSVTIQDGISATKRATVTCSSGSTPPCALKVDSSGGGTSSPTSVQGNVASGAADSGNPVKIAGVVATSLPTAGANGNRFNVMVDKFGRLVIVLNGDRGLKQVCSSITLTSTTETTICAAGGTGVFLDLEHLSCSNTSATLVRVDIRDSTGGTVRKSMALAANGGGFEMNIGDSTWPQATANNNWTAQLSGSVTDVRCQAVAMKNQ